MYSRLQYIQATRTKNNKRYLKSIVYPVIPLDENDIYITTTVGDRLDSLADRFYNDVRLWWVISTANPHIISRDSYALKPNLEIRIPSNISRIKKDFDNKNDLFTYTSFKWRITGTRQEVFRVNEITTKNASQILPGIGNELFSLQFWRAPKNSPTTLAKKLDLLR